MQFVDKALARRLESCEEMPQVFYAREYQKTRPEIGAAEEEICGGHMVFAGLGSPIGRATGTGLDRPLTAEDLDRIEDFYRGHKAPSQVDVCPLHPPEVFEMFKERGYAFIELNNVLYRKLDPDEKFPPPPDHCTIRRSHPEEAEITGSIVEQAFFPDGAPDPYRGLLAPLYQMEGGLAFVAEIDGEACCVRNGPRHPRAQSLCAVRRGNAYALPRAGTANCSPAGANGSGRKGGMRIRCRRNARRQRLATKCRAPWLPRCLQQSNGDQATAALVPASRWLSGGRPRPPIINMHRPR